MEGVLDELNCLKPPGNVASHNVAQQLKFGLIYYELSLETYFRSLSYVWICSYVIFGILLFLFSTSNENVPQNTPTSINAEETVIDSKITPQMLSDDLISFSIDAAIAEDEQFARRKVSNENLLLVLLNAARVDSKRYKEQRWLWRPYSNATSVYDMVDLSFYALIPPYERAIFRPFNFEMNVLKTGMYGPARILRLNRELQYAAQLELKRHIGIMEGWYGGGDLGYYQHQVISVRTEDPRDVLRDWLCEGYMDKAGMRRCDDDAKANEMRPILLNKSFSQAGIAYGEAKLKEKIVPIYVLYLGNQKLVSSQVDPLFAKLSLPAPMHKSQELYYGDYSVPLVSFGYLKSDGDNTFRILVTYEYPKSYQNATLYLNKDRYKAKFNPFTSSTQNYEDVMGESGFVTVFSYYFYMIRPFETGCFQFQLYFNATNSNGDKLEWNMPKEGNIYGGTGSCGDIYNWGS